MRISDWSSDGCSSELAWSGAGGQDWVRLRRSGCALALVTRTTYDCASARIDIDPDHRPALQIFEPIGARSGIIFLAKRLRAGHSRVDTCPNVGQRAYLAAARGTIGFVLVLACVGGRGTKRNRSQA